MKNIENLLIFYLILTVSGHLYSSEHAFNLKDLLSPEDFKVMGLDKLSEEELYRLSYWILSGKGEDDLLGQKIFISPQDSVEIVAEIRDSDFVAQPLNEKESINTTIDGSFEGWSGSTEFKLSNGQIWRQRLKGKWRYKATSPSVEIKKNFLGFYVMRVDEKKAVGVTRIK